MKLKQEGNSLIDILQEESDDYSIKQLHGASITYSLICRKVKFVILKQMKNHYLNNTIMYYATVAKLELN